MVVDLPLEGSPECAVLTALEDGGIIIVNVYEVKEGSEYKGKLKVLLAQKALQQLIHAWSCRNPQPVLRSTEQLLSLENAAQDMSDYELLRRLELDGWTWRPWATGKQAEKGPLAALPIAYRNGEPLIFRSTLRVPRSYLITLLKAQDLVIVFILGADSS